MDEKRSQHASAQNSAPQRRRAAGPFGVALAYPLAVVGLILIKMLYIQDVLGDEVVILSDHRRKKRYVAEGQ
ncbi:MAG: hypothetical protein JXA37_00920 [Chloroflexia bacterium]|nr:hypothetical protein [Chloroflexia bacterium]